MSKSAFQFLLENEGSPYRSARCYLTADPKIDDRFQWDLHLEAPADADWVIEISDLKDWMLHGKPNRQIIYDRTNPKTPFRDLIRENVFREYLRKILSEIPERYRLHRKYALMPSIADDNSRTRYKEAIQDAIPEITVLPEPEMVGEYFRLVKRDLKLQAGQNNVILVVDVGASTANMTLIVSRRDSTILEVDTKGAQRDLRLRALRGDSDNHAGLWVDKRLLAMIDPNKNESLLKIIEDAKISVSRTGKPAFLADADRYIDQDILTAVSTELIMELRPLFERLCERLYENQVSSDDASKKSEQRRIERGVTGPQDAYKLIDSVLLAGGTSLLPGFEKAMFETLFLDERRPSVLHVGSAFPIAAAAGGLAHILQSYDEPRLREAPGVNNPLFKAQLQATLPHEILLGIKSGTRQEEHIVVLDPNDPFIDDGGVRSIDMLPMLQEGSEPKTRLIPARTAGVDARRGRKSLPTRINTTPASFNLNWDPRKERAFITSKDTGDTSHLWIDVGRLRRRKETSAKKFDGHISKDGLAVDPSDDIIFDFGMSKIVAVTAYGGKITTKDLEDLIRIGKESEVIDGIPQPSTVHDAVVKLVGDFDEESTKCDQNYNVKKEVKLGETNQSPIVSRLQLAEQREADNQLNWKGRNVSLNHGWNARTNDQEFSHALMSVSQHFKSSCPEINFDDIVVAILALTVRPLVLLSGPPGCGKSILVRLIADILGKGRGQTFHDIAVQAHWDNDTPLFNEGGHLYHLLEKSDDAHLILFDEFNLTRPEYYLSRLFHALESGENQISFEQRIASCRVFGTLNIDESSRPPSPKVIDRCFLIELSPINPTMDGLVELKLSKDFAPLPGLPEIAPVNMPANDLISGFLQEIKGAVDDHGLRYDILPSRRVLSDIERMLSLHHRLDLQGTGLLDRDDLVDRLIASRVLVKFSGAYEQLSQALSAAETYVQDVEGLPRTQRRLKLARQQARLGFVSPWQ